MTGRVYPSVRDAIFATAHSGTPPMQDLARDLDWSKSEMSMHTMPEGPTARAFPCDDDHLVKLMRLTGDFSILMTLAHACGFELVPRRERTAEEVAALRADLQAFGKRMEQLSLGLAPAPGRKK